MYKKSVIIMIIAALGATILPNCTNDLDLSITSKSTPVVYFMFNPQDSIYSLSLTKSLNGSENAFNLARKPDLLIYKNAEIKLEGWADNYIAWESTFSPSDIVKNPGIFPSVKGHCYQTNNVLTDYDNEGNIKGPYYEVNSFRFIIYLPELSEPVYARIPLIHSPEMISPNMGRKEIDLYPPNEGFYNVAFEVKPEEIKYCELVCVFKYEEYHNKWLEKTIEFPLRQNIQIQDKIASTYLYPDLFFNKIASYIQKQDSTYPKRFISMDLLIFGSDKYYHDYKTTYINAGNTDIPPSGNIVNGLGLFSMIRTVRLEDMHFSIKTLDSLIGGRFTRHLGFTSY